MDSKIFSNIISQPKDSQTSFLQKMIIKYPIFWFWVTWFWLRMPFPLQLITPPSGNLGEPASLNHLWSKREISLCTNTHLLNVMGNEGPDKGWAHESCLLGLNLTVTSSPPPEDQDWSNPQTPKPNNICWWSKRDDERTCNNDNHLKSYFFLVCIPFTEVHLCVIMIIYILSWSSSLRSIWFRMILCSFCPSTNQMQGYYFGKIRTGLTTVVMRQDHKLQVAFTPFSQEENLTAKQAWIQLNSTGEAGAVVVALTRPTFSSIR